MFVGLSPRMEIRYNQAMSKIYTAIFGHLPLRFALRSDDIFVSKNDLFAAILDCFTPDMRQHGEQFIESCLNFMADSEDKNSIILGESEIGPAIQFHAAGSLLSALSDLIDVDDHELRESSFRVTTLLRWFSSTLVQVDQHFGRGIREMLESVKSRLDRINPALPVIVTQGDGMYTAECDALSLVTEAKTFEELTEKVWELAPDMIDANNLAIDLETLRLRFEVQQDAYQLKVN